MSISFPFALMLVVGLAGCECGSSQTDRLGKATTGSAGTVAAPKIRWRFPAPKRLIAIGDVHGDLAATRKALRLGGLIDDSDSWIGGDTVLVQTGDMLDRGDGEQAIMDLFLKLKDQAKAAGGAVHLLNGNHELMNVAGDFRYVTRGGFTDFDDVPGLNLSDPRLSSLPASKRARAAAFLPGGVYAVKLAPHPIVVVVGDTVFTHGGVSPEYAGQIERMNQEVTVWLLGGSNAGLRVSQLPKGPVWNRDFGDDPDAADCERADRTLATLGVKRMVIGHTRQPQIRPACGDKIWRVDVGMAAAYGGNVEVLEIREGKPRPIR